MEMYSLKQQINKNKITKIYAGAFFKKVVSKHTFKKYIIDF